MSPAPPNSSCFESEAWIDTIEIHSSSGVVLMKAFWLKSSLVAILLLLVAAVGVLPTRSDTGQKPKSFAERQTQKRGARATTPLSYRSPGAHHKLVIANDDL